uniref:DUF1484 family protein n=3 Tax=Cupriavidus taiwanensis TaxID=164546 RepID=UPI001E28CFF0
AQRACRGATRRTCHFPKAIATRLPPCGGYLTLLDLQSDSIPECIGLHALLSPLRQQLIESADRLQALV